MIPGLHMHSTHKGRVEVVESVWDEIPYLASVNMTISSRLLDRGLDFKVLRAPPADMMKNTADKVADHLCSQYWIPFVNDSVTSTMKYGYFAFFMAHVKTVYGKVDTGLL